MCSGPIEMHAIRRCCGFEGSRYFPSVFISKNRHTVSLPIVAVASACSSCFSGISHEQRLASCIKKNGLANLHLQHCILMAIPATAIRIMLRHRCSKNQRADRNHPPRRRESIAHAILSDTVVKSHCQATADRQKSQCNHDVAGLDALQSCGLSCTWRARQRAIRC